MALSAHRPCRPQDFGLGISFIGSLVGFIDLGHIGFIGFNDVNGFIGCINLVSLVDLVTFVSLGGIRFISLVGGISGLVNSSILADCWINGPVKRNGLGGFVGLSCD